MNRWVRFFGVFMMLSFNWDGTYGIVMMLGDIKGVVGYDFRSDSSVVF